VNCKKIAKGTLTAMMMLAFLVTVDNAVAGDTGFPVTESGIILGYGTGNIEGGHYEPLLLVWHIGFRLKEFSSEQSQDHNNIVTFYIESQINPVVNPESDVEFGISAGLKYMHYLTNTVSAHLMASFGPHWITVNTESQAKGFVFSSTIGAGISVFVTDNSAVSLGFRARHLSNANLSKPNGGIETCFGTIGYSIFF